MLWDNFLLKDLGNANYFLGLELSRSSKGIYLSQRKYCLPILKDSVFLAAKPNLLPMSPNFKFSTNGTLLDANSSSQYSILLGALSTCKFQAQIFDSLCTN